MVIILFAIRFHIRRDVKCFFQSSLTRIKVAQQSLLHMIQNASLFIDINVGIKVISRAIISNIKPQFIRLNKELASPAHVWIKGTCVAVNHQRTFAETSAMLHENTTLNARLCIGRYLWGGKRKAWNVCWLNCDVILEATTSKPITALSAALDAEGEKVRRVLMWEKDPRVWIIVCRPVLKCYMSVTSFLFLPSLRCYLSLNNCGKNDNKRLFNIILLKKKVPIGHGRVLSQGTGFVVKQFISGRAGVTGINGELRHCSGEHITVEAVRSWGAASIKNVLQLEKHTGPGSHGGLLFWWDSLPVSIKARICCFADLEAPR